MMKEKQNIRTRALILAAGKSKRMKSAKSKVLHKILGRTLIEFVVDALDFKAVERIGVVAGSHNQQEVQQVLGDRVDYIIQREQLGTGHAVLASAEWLKDFEGSLVVVVGDSPFITPQIIKELINVQHSKNFAAVFLSAVYENPPAYGRVVRDGDGKVVRIVEEKDAAESEKKIKEVSSSHYCFNTEKLMQALKLINNNNIQNEYYLPDVIERLISQGEAVEALPVDDPLLTFGINSRNEMVYGIRELRRRIIEKWLNESVTIIEPDNTYIDATVDIGKDVVIHPFTYLSDFSRIGDNCEIGPFARIENSKIKDGQKISWANIENNQGSEFNGRIS